jgi:hypothetical protein
MSVGSEIQDSDYNAIRKKIIAIMGNGGTNPLTDQADATFGYGQTLVSSDVAAGQDITKDQWDALRFDILNARIHQDGVTPSIVTAIRGQPIRFGVAHPNTAYDVQSDIAIANKFNLGAGQFVIDSGTAQVRSTPWVNSVSATATITFGSVDYARWFFNSGCKLRINSTRSGGTALDQNSAWSSLLNSVGIIEFGGNTSPIGFYSLTDVNQILRTQTATSPYSDNSFTVRVRSNVANNSNGGATQLIFTLSWVDGYVDPDVLLGRPGGGTFNPPDDGVDGNLSFTIEEQRASGILQPSGTGGFIINRPSYSSTEIVGT